MGAYEAGGVRWGYWVRPESPLGSFPVFSHQRPAILYPGEPGPRLARWPRRNVFGCLVPSVGDGRRVLYERPVALNVFEACEMVTAS